MDKISTNGSMIEQIDLARANRSGFDMSFNNYLTGKLGALIPTRVQEILPGDRIKGNTQMVINFEPLIQPMLANMYAKQESFYVPLRQIWTNADRFFTGKRGFEKDVPSVTLKYIAESLTTYQLLPIDVDDNAVLEVPSDVTSLLSTYKNHIISFADTYSVKDLFIPLFAAIDDCSSYYSNSDNFPVGQEWLDFIEYFRQFLDKVNNFWTNISSLSDYMGISCPCYTYVLDDDSGAVFSYASSSEIPLNWLPFRAAYMVWYWYYRDKILEESAPDPEDYMTDTVEELEIPLMLLLRHRCWSKDTFTTALTNTGSGNVIVPVMANQNYQILGDTGTDNTSDSAAAHAAGADVYKVEIGGKYYMLPNQYLAAEKTNYQSSDKPAISLDLIERAKRLLTWLAKRLILGVEYDDVVYSSFMVKLSSVRMHIPELLDSSRSVVSMNTLVNNTKSDGSVMGDKAAVAWCNDSSQGFNYFAEEHGYLLSFMSIMPEQSYMHGISRKYLRQNRFDFAWPEFSQIGMDAIYNIELTAEDLSDSNALQVFGYQGRYYDYKCNQNEEHGLIRTKLDYLTFSRKFSLDVTKDNYPLLNPYFVHCFPSLDMFVMEDQNEDVFRADIHHAFAMERCLPVPSDEIY